MFLTNNSFFHFLFFLIVAIAILILIALKLLVFFKISKRFDKTILFKKIAIFFFLYEALYFLFVLIYPTDINFIFNHSSATVLLSSIPLILVSCLFFFLINRFMKLFNLKKAIAVFLLMFFIATPILSVVIGKIATTINFKIATGHNLSLSDGSSLFILDPLLYPPFGSYQTTALIIRKIGDSLGEGAVIKDILMGIFASTE
ncbi:MAG: hypothetical protein WC242_05515 [Candidatus Paceibacterota bacterium]|jgi:hypothetical protein